MKINKNIITLIALLVVLGSNAQNEGVLKRATKGYDKFSYVKTTDILLDVAEKGYESKELLQKLGNSYYFNNKMEDASKWYGKLLDSHDDVDAEYFYRYAQTLKSLEQYGEADIWMHRFSEIRGNEKRSQNFSVEKNYLDVIKSLSEDFEVKNLSINTALSDFGSNQYNNQLIFASSRGAGKNYVWNDQPYLNLYSAEKLEDNTYGNVVEFNKGISTKYHESSVSFIPSKKVMYFTRNNYFEKRLKRDKEGVNRLQIYKATLDESNAWDNVIPVHFNSDAYSVAHPTVNASGTKLYFASDMPGTIGNSDLYVIDINRDGTLGTPINLGDVVNTEGQETFPFINENGDLYFSSNGHNGLGGLDVYIIRNFEKDVKNKKAVTVENLGKPINSSMDDFGYFENLNTMEGFFTSNREGGKGDDDIYSFTVPNCVQDLTGKVFDGKSKEVIPNASLVLVDSSGKEIDQTIADPNGYYEFSKVLKCSSEYLIRASKDKYLTNEERLSSTINRKENINKDLYLEKDEVEIADGTNLREALSLSPIYFYFDKYNIRKDAEVELQKVIAVMKQFPHIKIDVRSHTDSRATKSYNERLSSLRNKSTINYIIEKGNIDSDRLTGKGYGESELVNNCADGVSCTEDEHQLNRRSDFIVGFSD